MTEEIKREYDNWLLAINREFPNKGFDIIVEPKNGEFVVSFTPSHTTPIIFFQTEIGIRQYLAAIYQTLQVLTINERLR